MRAQTLNPAYRNTDIDAHRMNFVLQREKILNDLRQLGAAPSQKEAVGNELDAISESLKNLF